MIEKTSNFHTVCTLYSQLIPKFVLFRFRKHREKVSKRKKDEEDIEEEEEVPATLIPNEYQQGVPLHQQVKRRISETDFSPSGVGDDVASVCGSSVGSFEPMDLSNRSPGNAKKYFSKIAIYYDTF